MKNGEHDNEQKRPTATSIIVVYFVSKDPPPPFVFLMPILVAMLPTVTFGNWMMNDDTFVVCCHSLFYYTYIIQSFFCIFL